MREIPRKPQGEFPVLCGLVLSWFLRQEYEQLGENTSQLRRSVVQRFLLIVGLLVSSFAFAQPTADIPPGTKDLVDKAKQHFQINQYQESLELFQKAYLLSQHPALLFNIGQCHRMLHQCEEAENSFSQYLKETPNSPHRALAERLIEECVPAEIQPASTPAASLPTQEKEKSLTAVVIRAAHPKASYQVSIETTQKTFSCAAAVTQKTPCSLSDVPPGVVQVRVEGDREFTQELQLAEGESTFTIEQRGYAVHALSFSAPAVIFLGTSFGLAASGTPTLDSFGVGAALGAVSAVVMIPVGLLIDRYKLPPHKAIRKTLFAAPQASVFPRADGAMLGLTLSF
jgi:hypothetical protein